MSESVWSRLYSNLSATYCFIPVAVDKLGRKELHALMDLMCETATRHALPNCVSEMNDLEVIIYYNKIIYYI